MTVFKFSPKDRVRRIGYDEVRTVEAIHEMDNGEETKYHIQLGTDVATRVWAKESELELIPAQNRAMARSVDPREKHLTPKKPKALKAFAPSPKPYGPPKGKDTKKAASKKPSYKR